MLHEGSAECAVKLVATEDDVCLRIRNSALLDLKRKVKIMKRWRKRQRIGIAARVRTGKTFAE